MMFSISFITGNVNLDHLVNAVSSRFLHCKVIFSLLALRLGLFVFVAFHSLDSAD